MYSDELCEVIRQNNKLRDILPKRNISFPIMENGKLIAWEKGGGYSSTGSANIVCGPEGEKLIPKEINKSTVLACEKHACFKEDNLVVLSYSHGRISESLFIDHFLIEKGEIKHKEIYAYEDETRDIVDRIPQEIKKFEDAIKAVVKKANWYHCRSILYQKEKGE